MKFSIQTPNLNIVGTVEEFNNSESDQQQFNLSPTFWVAISGKNSAAGSSAESAIQRLSETLLNVSYAK